MNIEQEFKIGDCVCWNAYYEDLAIECGKVKEFWEEDLIIIDLGKIDGCTVSTGARKINGQWLVHRPYQGCKDPIYKI